MRAASMPRHAQQHIFVLDHPKQHLRKNKRNCQSKVWYQTMFYIWCHQIGHNWIGCIQTKCKTLTFSAAPAWHKVCCRCWPGAGCQRETLPVFFHIKITVMLTMTVITVVIGFCEYHFTIHNELMCVNTFSFSSIVTAISYWTVWWYIDSIIY